MGMKSIFIFLFFLAILPSPSKAFTATSFINPTVIEKKETAKKAVLSYRESKKILETSIGRKLSFKEKLALRIQTSVPRYDNENERRANSQAVTGFILSICGLVLLWPLLIPGLIISNNALLKERVNPGILKNGNYGLAKAGKIIGIVGLAIIIVAIIIIAAILAGGGFAGL